MMVLTKALIRESEENAVKSGAFSFRELMLKAGNSATDIILKKVDILNCEQLTDNPNLINEILKDGIKIYG